MSANPHIADNGLLFPTTKEHLRRLNDTLRFARLIMEDGGLYELRAITPGKKPRARLFDDAEELVLTAKAWNRDGLNAYMTVNPAIPDSTGSLHDEDIDHINWMVFDIDPIRESGKQKEAATDRERATALDELYALIAHLTAKGWGEPSVIFESGNGYWAMFSTEQENTRKAAHLRSAALTGLKLTFPLIDPSVYNASRIVRIPGTMNWKAGRPSELITINGGPA